MAAHAGAVLAAALALALAAPLGSGEAAGAAVPSFRNDVLPILTRAGCNSGACHGAMAGKNGFKLTLRGYDPEADHASLTRRAAGRRVVPGDPWASLMLLKPSLGVPHGGGEKLTPGSPDHETIARWIQAGAPPPLETDPRVESIEVEPRSRMLRAGEELQLEVRARYSDGTERVVTPWVKFGSSDEGVVAVDPAGKARITAPGEAAATAWFSSKVAYARLGAPFPGEVDPAAFARSPRRGFIDERILEKLEALHIPPSPPAGDVEFVRRIYLDALGVLPTPREVQRYALDPSPDKRAKLIDTLLEREEYVDLWAYRWSDLLLLSSRKVPGDALNAFYRFIRESVAQDKPWDRFAREILTATGRTTENGAAAYFLMHKEPIDLTETTSQTFLGLSLTCCRCHNHPMEKWLQDDYYGMAGLFARVKLKNGDRSGEAVVLTANTGEVIHPRRGVALPPRPLEQKPLDPEEAPDRRAALADWLTSPGNPYFTRAVVNRVWRGLMGRGLVEPEDDLRLTNPASHEDLLEELGREFQKNGFRVKPLVRLILSSAAYGLSSRPVPGNESDSKYYSHFIVRRLPAEVILDAYSQVTGIPTDFPGYPRGFRALQLPDSQVPSGFLKTFGRPDRNITCSCERQGEPSLPQALHVANGDTLDKKLRAKGNVLERLLERKLPDPEILDELFLAALGRYPAGAEREEALRALEEAAQGSSLPAGQQQPGQQQAVPQQQSSTEPQAARRAVLEDLLWGLLASREFLFNH